VWNQANLSIFYALSVFSILIFGTLLADSCVKLTKIEFQVNIYCGHVVL